MKAREQSKCKIIANIFLFSDQRDLCGSRESILPMLQENGDPVKMLYVHAQICILLSLGSISLLYISGLG
jgi:hypothetical protein